MTLQLADSPSPPTPNKPQRERSEAEALALQNQGCLHFGWVFLVAALVGSAFGETVFWRVVGSILLGGMVWGLWVNQIVRGASQERWNREGRAKEEKKRLAKQAAEDKAEAHRIAVERSAMEAAAQQRLQWEYKVNALSLTCGRCGEQALPVPDSRDRYVCAACNHRFVGARHDVPLPPGSTRAS